MNNRMLLLTESITAKIKSPPHIEELAAQVNVSPSRMRQIFKAETGMPFAEYVRHLQMERARELLETTFMRVQEIGLTIGFGDHGYFNRAFKKKYGLSPNKYRDENHQDFKKLNKNP